MENKKTVLGWGIFLLITIKFAEPEVIQINFLRHAHCQFEAALSAANKFNLTVNLTYPMNSDYRSGHLVNHTSYSILNYFYGDYFSRISPLLTHYEEVYGILTST
jgi:hypothetical protein